MTTRRGECSEAKEPRKQAGRRASGASQGAAEGGRKKKERTTSAFAFFKDEERPKLLQQHPDVKPSQFSIISNHLGTSWKELDDEARRKYMELAAAAKSCVGVWRLVG